MKAIRIEGLKGNAVDLDREVRYHRIWPIDETLRARPATFCAVAEERLGLDAGALDVENGEEDGLAGLDREFARYLGDSGRVRYLVGEGPRLVAAGISPRVQIPQRPGTGGTGRDSPD